ncbi:hypothetical protein BHM03_00004755 [Ensete ventricosum]|nr:hypothetical protein BHM03_00004755 [Ensete ventricosum]
MGLGDLQNPSLRIWRKISIRVELRGGSTVALVVAILICQFFFLGVPKVVLGGASVHPVSRPLEEYEFVCCDVPLLHCSAGALATSGSPSIIKNIVKLDIVVEESARLGSARVASSSTSIGKRLGGLEEIEWACSRARLGLLLGVCWGILHECLIVVGSPDVTLSMFKLMPRPRSRGFYTRQTPVNRTPTLTVANLLGKADVQFLRCPYYHTSGRRGAKRCASFLIYRRSGSAVVMAAQSTPSHLDQIPQKPNEEERQEAARNSRPSCSCTCNSVERGKRRPRGMAHRHPFLESGNAVGDPITQPHGMPTDNSIPPSRSNTWSGGPPRSTQSRTHSVRPLASSKLTASPESSLSSSSFFKRLPPLLVSSGHRSIFPPQSRCKMKLSVDSLLSSLKRSSSSKNEKKKSRRSVARTDASVASNSSFSASSSSEEEYSAVSGRQATPRSVLPPDHGKAPLVFLPDEAAWLDLFNVFDCDGDGKITKRELEAVLRRLVPDPPTAEEVASMVAEVDRDGDGCISLDEFGALGELLGGGRGGEAELRDAFAVFDADGDGKISAEELLGVFASLGDGGCTLDDCRRMIGGVDTDGDGFVGFDDFVRMMDGQLYEPPVETNIASDVREHLPVLIYKTKKGNENCIKVEEIGEEEAVLGVASPRLQDGVARGAMLERNPRQSSTFESFGMVMDVIVDEGRNEVVGMVIARLHPKHQRSICTLAGVLEVVGQQLIVKELVTLSLSGEA